MCAELVIFSERRDHGTGMGRFSSGFFIWRSALVTALFVGPLLFALSTLAEKKGTNRDGASKNKLEKGVVAVNPESERTEPPTREEIILRGSPLFSYGKWVEDYQPQMDLAPYFPSDLQKAPPVDRSALDKEWGKALPKFQALRASQERQDSLQRGEIEQPAVRQKIEQLLRLSLLRLRLIEGSQLAAWLSTEGQVWENALFGLAYDEATKLGLDTSIDLRTQIWRELLHKAKFRSDLPKTELRAHVNRLQLAWPVDRIVVAEARRTLSPAAQRIANGIGIELQKDPQRSVKSLRQRLRGGELRELSTLEELWSDSDVERMRNEQKLIEEIRALTQK